MDSSASASAVIRRIVDRVSEILCDTKWFGILGIFLPFIVIMFRNGLGFFPDLSVAHHLYLAREFPAAAPLPENAHFLYNSMVGAILAHFLGVNSYIGWMILSLAMLIIAFIVVAVMTAHAAGRSAVGLMMAAFAAAGVSTVLFSWIGSYDLYTFVGLTMIALSKRWWLSLIGGLILGLNSYEMGLIAIVALAVVGWADERSGKIRAAIALAAVLAGHFALVLWQSMNDVSSSRASAIAEYGVVNLFGTSIQAMPTLAFTWLSAATLLVGWMFIRRIVNRWRLVIALLIAVVPSMGVVDETRIGALLVWPVLAWLLVKSFQTTEQETKRAVSLTLVIACVYPAIVIWTGKAYLVTWWLAPVKEAAGN